MTCPSCGTINPPDHRFCSQCGAALTPRERAPSAFPVRSERRLVTVLFADLVDFTGMSETRDPEDVRAILTAYFERTRETVGRFDGVVDKFIGDAVMAVWGAVEAHEDDAERAVRAGLELVDAVERLGEELGTPLAARVGILTGEASVGPGGNDRGLVVGDLVNTASRLQSAAEPGSVVVGEATCLASGDTIAFKPLGDLQVRGRLAPVPAYRAVGVTSGGYRFQPARNEPPLFGRERELATLEEALRDVEAARSARLVSVVGAAGMGKKRLVRELRRRFEGAGSPVAWLTGRSPSWGESAALWPVAEMIRGRLHIAETDETPKARMSMRTAMAELIPNERERLWVEPMVSGVLGIDPVPRDDRNELFAGLRTFFHRVADQSTTVLVFEDLHQAEATTIDFIMELVERTTEHPVLVLALFRPEATRHDPQWASARWATTVELGPLPDEAIRELLSAMTPGLPARAIAAIVDRAAGVPLFAVEFMRMLLATGDVARSEDGFVIVGDIDTVPVPDSLQAIVGARLDRMLPAQRELVQDASVLGLTFYVDALAAIRGEDPSLLRRRLDELVEREVLTFEPDPRTPGGGRFRFAQALIREVAYGRLTLADRHVKHLDAAEHFEGLGDVELAGKVARHYLFAYETAAGDDKDELEQRACRALCTAATRAANLQSHYQALVLWQQAISITREPAERAEIHESAAVSALRAGAYEDGVRHSADAAAIYEELGDDDGRLRALTTQASLHLMQFHAPEAVALLEPLYESPLGSPAVRLTMELEFARALMINQESERAARVADDALVAGQDVVGPETVIDGIITKATALASLGRTLEATALLRGAVDLADEHQLHTPAGRALNNLSVVVTADSPRRAGEIATEMLRRGRRFADSAWLYRTRNFVAQRMLSEGQFDEAIALLSEVDIDDLPDFWQRMYRLTLATEEVYRRPSPEAFQRARAILDAWETSTDPQLRSMVASGQASLDLLSGDIESAMRRDPSADFDTTDIGAVALVAMWSRNRDHIETALKRSRDMPMRGRFTDAIAMTLQAGLDALDGRVDDAVAGFTAAIDILDAVGTALDRAQARALFHAYMGDLPEAVAAGRAALEWVRSVGAVQLEHAWADGLPRDSEEAAAG